MKKLLSLAALLCAAGLYAQSQEYVTPLNEVAVEKNQAAVAVGGGSVTGGTCTNQVVTALDTSGVPTCADITSAMIPAATITMADIADGSANSVLGRASNSSGVMASIAPTAAGQSLRYDGTTTAWQTYPVNPATETVLWEDFYVRPLTAGVGTAAAAGSMFGIGAGTTSGFVNPTVNADGNHPGVVEISTGTSSTGTYSINGGFTSNTALDTVNIAGGEVVEWLVNIPILATGTDTFKVWIGLCDITTSNGDCADGLNVYSVWDGGATNNKWGCGAAKAASRTTTNATDVVTTGWHKIRIEVNSDATSIAYKVDGAAISCSPYTGANIPTGVGNGMAVQLRIGASAGCTSVGTCHVAADYAYFRKSLTR